ncbi:MAG: type II toxin-antitoxin system HipA family toxin [Gammaproteobacteria bacterium]|nr:type II toxin-antitoxin system HipA family toxin [Gammaproteobacteria bacterium]MBU1653824.1 type II toxin-antitoxin system HipA family toxin [Gammaproteobacteria bacterium]MBU1962152.1 type II toxin-antitoxin system HipA family toxin [Gammaproteobacteria bacterium]
MSTQKTLPGNELAVWSLTEPQTPVRVGTALLALGGRGVAFAYDHSWLAAGYPLSGDMPLQRALLTPRVRDWLFGALDDAMPDRWGERAIRFIDNPPRATALDLLYFAGDHRFGALGFSVDQTAYAPHRGEPLPSADSLHALQALIERIDANEPLTEQEKLIAGTTKTMGGAHPKALVTMDGKDWIAKFPRGANLDVGLIEHASLKLAAQAGINVAHSVALPGLFGHVVTIERFDRHAGERLRALSAKTVLLAGVGFGAPPLDELSYGAMASFLLQAGAMGIQAQQRIELFRRMAFNILIENSDDHEKNHAFLFDAGYWSLAPAFDVLPNTSNAGYQQMGVGKQGALGSLGNALSECNLFGLSRDQAIEEWFKVADVVAEWDQVYAGLGVSSKDIGYLRTFIDQPERKAMRLRSALDGL